MPVVFLYMSSVDLEVTGGFIGKTGSTVAVTDFEGRGISSLEAQTLTDRFRTAVAITGVVRLVERRMMTELLEERGVPSSWGALLMNVL